MPRGFLVKRKKAAHAVQPTFKVWGSVPVPVLVPGATTTTGAGSLEEDSRSDSGSEVDSTGTIHTHFGSPDSGYISSPLSVHVREHTENHLNNNNNNLDAASTPGSSPVSVRTYSSGGGSPYYLTNFDRLSVRSPTGRVLDFQGNSFHHVLNAAVHDYQQSAINYSLADNRTFNSVTSDGDKTLLASPEPRNTVPQKTTSSLNKNSANPKQLILSPNQHLSSSHRNGIRLSSPSGDPLNLSSPNGDPLNLSSPNNKKRSNAELEFKQRTPKKSKAIRKITFDEDTSSPVSGTIIRQANDMDEEGKTVVCGDIDSSLNFVEATPEARAELEQIENKIGDYVCMLCKEYYEDAFQLAQHRCSRIVHVEYRCPECDKVFNCPANLASHRRWHKPRPNAPSKPAMQPRLLPAPPDVTRALVANEQYPNDADFHRRSTSPPLAPPPPSSTGEEPMFPCHICPKKFRRQAYLRKHLQTHNNSIKQLDSKSMLRVISERDHMCSLCGQACADALVLERHMKTHTTETFTCKYCSSVFHSSPGLTRHINKCHPSENRQVILLQLPNVHRPC